jgi:hypothetical protein
MDDTLRFPELYRDRLEMSLAFGDFPTAGEGRKRSGTRTVRAIATTLAICTGLCLAHIVGW